MVGLLSTVPAVATAGADLAVEVPGGAAVDAVPVCPRDHIEGCTALLYSCYVLLQLAGQGSLQPMCDVI